MSRASSARRAEADRLLRLAIQHRDGEGVRRDLGRARKLFEEAARAGSPEAMSALGHLHLRHGRSAKDKREGIRWLEAAARAGIWSAPHFLGRAAEDDGDWATAHKWYERALEQGDLSSGMRLAKHYLDRLDVRFHRTGVALLRRAIRKSAIDPAWAYTELARCYLEGQGVPRSRKKAIQHLQRAARGDLAARHLLQELKRSTASKNSRSRQARPIPSP
jgi:TPR repeat protein